MYQESKIMKGKITGIEPYGIFVELNNKKTGLIHISQISNNFVKNINDYVEINEEIYVKVIGEESENHLNLSIKEIDYKFGENKKFIKEEGEGFIPLAEKRPIWIKEKIEEMNNKKK